MAIKVATDATFEELVLKNDKPVVVDFWAVWCGPCKMVAPEMEKLAEKYEGVVDVVKVDVDANPGLSQAYQIMSIPTIAYFKPGDQPKGVVGLPADGAARAEVRADRPAGHRDRRDDDDRGPERGLSPPRQTFRCPGTPRGIIVSGGPPRPLRGATLRGAVHPGAILPGVAPRRPEPRLGAVGDVALVGRRGEAHPARVARDRDGVRCPGGRFRDVGRQSHVEPVRVDPRDLAPTACDRPCGPRPHPRWRGRRRGTARSMRGAPARRVVDPLMQSFGTPYLIAPCVRPET